MDESEDNMSAEDIKSESSQSAKTKPKKRSLVERELETSLTSRVTSPITNAEASNTSRYGRARRLKTEAEFMSFEKMVIKIEKSPTSEKTPIKVQSPVYKMHASNSPMRSESPKGTPNKAIKIEQPDLENQIENIYHENISLSRFGSEEKKHTPNKIPKVYVRKDLIQKRDEEETITLIKNLFSPAKSGKKSNSHINNILERSSEKYGLNASKSQNGYASVVKTLDFDSKKKKKESGNTKMLSKSELFEMEAKCEYQVGDLAWSRMGTYPFWPCIVTREPSSGMFVKKKLFGRIERDVIHVTFFGDNGRRGWIVDTMLRKFHGQLEFEATREQFTPADKKKDPRLYAAFFISEKKQPQWNISVEEAELLLREPKRLRIDILNDMLMKARALKTTPRQNKSGKITRTASDVSLSESLYDTLFSEDDGKEDSDRSRNRSRNKSLDVSEVVTACLDNMAAKTGITKIQRQSHMDRWLQKAKSKTPEKSQARAQLVPQKVEKKETKVSSAKKKRRSPKPNSRPLTQKPYSFRRSANESQPPHLENDNTNNLEFAPSLNSTLNNIDDDSDAVINIEQLQSGIGVIAKVESLSDSANESLKGDEVDEHLNQEIITEDKENNICGSANIQKNKTSESTNDTDTPVTDNLGVDSIEAKSFTESESESANIQKNKTNESTNDTDTPVTYNLGVDSIEATSSTESESESANIQKNKTFESTNDTDTPVTDNLGVDSIEAKSFTESESESANIQKNQSNESTNDTDNLGVNSIEAKSFTASESYSVSTSLESDTVPVDTKTKTLDSNAMNTSSIDDSKEKNKTAAEDELVVSDEKSKSSIKESKELNTISTESDKALDSNEMDISSTEENKDFNEIASQNGSIASFTETKSFTDDVSTKMPNNVLNGYISDHNISKMSSKDSDLKTDSTQNSSNGSQERDMNDFFNPLSTEVSKKPYTDPEFLKYLEIRQDSLMDQYPDLTQDEIVDYLHKTWLYEEKSSGKTKETDDNKQSNRGLNKSKSKSKKKQDRTTRRKKINESKGKFEYDGHSNHVHIDKCIEKPDTMINSYNEIHSDIDVSEELNTHKNVGSNEVKETNELKITHEIILNTNKNISNELSAEISKSPKLNICIEENSSVPILEGKGTLHEDMDVSYPEEECFEEENTLETETYESKREITVADLEGKETLREDMDVSYPEKELLEEENTLKTETYEPRREITVADSENTSNDTEINVLICEQTSESNSEPEERSCSFRCEKVNNINEDVNIPNSENKLYKQEVKETIPKSNVTVADSQFILNCKPITVGVSDETEVEIIASKEQEIKNKDEEKYDNDILISAVDLDDELSDDSLDISYAISPLSVKGDEPNEDLTQIKANDLIHGNQNKEINEKPMVNGVCDSDVVNVDIDRDIKCTNIADEDILKEAGPKESVVSNETEHVINDKKEEKNANHTVPNKEIVDNIKLNDVVQMNGTLVSKFMDDLEGDNASIHSEDSEPLSVTKSKLKLKRQERTNKYANPEFVKYLEIRQDDVMDEHPELNQDEIVEYLYKTWLYEENSKSEIRKTDDVQQLSLVKGLGERKPETKKRKARETKDKKKEKDTILGKDSDVETASVKSEESTTLKRWLRPKRYTSKLYADFDSSRDSSPAITDEITSETISLNSLDSDDSRANKYSPRTKASRPTRVKSDKLIVKDDIKVENEPLDLPNDTNLTKPSDSLPKMVNGFKDTDDIVNIKEEFDPETASLNSEGSEVSISKRKQKAKGDKKMDDPEFVKYLELRQDALIDENPQLTQEEIVGYLYKTWLYEESVKSDIKKSDEIEQSKLVKGINQDMTLPKKIVRKKMKLEKDVDEESTKNKPKRKSIQPYYNEDYSDIEDEIAIFEIMKNSPKVELSKIDLTDLKTKETEFKPKVTTETAKESIVQKHKEPEEVIEIEDEIDEVELFFEELTQPKPNLFKGLIREKVCEICEKISNLVKCKGCNGMFHVDCVKHELDAVEKVSLPSKGRKKKKKKLGRRAKNLEDSGSLSDEKSQDVSAENMSIDEIIEPVSHTVDAVNFEAQLEQKMKELLENNDKEIHYDSYSSDDGLDWEGTVAGKCEIVDVKLKPKSQSTDYADFKCNNCQKYEVPICFVCKSAVSKTGVEYRQRCQVAHCHKYYHLECLDHWPQTQFNSGESWNRKTNEKIETHMCPRHVCHTCVSDDPRGCKTRFSGDKLARCVRCPATYHSFTKCLPAGTQILTGSHIICPRHYEHRPGKVPCHVNTGWCFICALGGTLICCEYCPTSFHAECLNISPPEGNYMCEDCETGRLPLYGEMVWVKLGHYRWWPGIVLHPSEIPDNIMAVKHSPGEFVVRFFGQYDHYWVNRGRVFPFQEGDSGKISSQKSKIDAAFTTAMEHAQRACQILKNAQENEEESLDIASSLLPPHYVKLKVNKPVGSLVNKRVDIEESSLTQCDCDPSVPDPCGPYSQCLNRMLLTECGPICRAGDRCNNRAFEKRQYPKMVPYRTSHRGWGLKTLEDIKAGQFVIEYVGELIDEEEFKRRMARKHEIRDENFYFLTLDKERMIDAGPKGNLARFMNHCCEPNCETQKWTVLGDVRVGLFAIHDIPANSEVTFNYNLECAGIDKKRCMCGAKRCAGYIGAKPKQDESQTKKSKVAAKRTYKKRKNTEESPSSKSKLPKRPVGRPRRELSDIERDLLIIRRAALGTHSDDSRRGSTDTDRHKALKRKRVSFSADEVVCNGSPSVKKVRLEDKVD